MTEAWHPHTSTIILTSCARFVDGVTRLTANNGDVTANLLSAHTRYATSSIVEERSGGIDERSAITANRGDDVFTSSARLH